MNNKPILSILILVILLGILTTSGNVFAQTSTNYNLEWHVIGGGGQPVSSASFRVNSTAGQGVASPPYSISGSYMVAGGYWAGSDWLSIYLPLVIKG